MAGGEDQNPAKRRPDLAGKRWGSDVGSPRALFRWLDKEGRGRRESAAECPLRTRCGRPCSVHARPGGWAAAWWCGGGVAAAARLWQRDGDDTPRPRVFAGGRHWRDGASMGKGASSRGRLGSLPHAWDARAGMRCVARGARPTRPAA
jgi:hypothetical protein